MILFRGSIIMLPSRAWGSFSPLSFWSVFQQRLSKLEPLTAHSFFIGISKNAVDGHDHCLHCVCMDILQDGSDWPTRLCEWQSNDGKWRNCTCSVDPLMRKSNFSAVCAGLKWQGHHLGLWGPGGNRRVSPVTSAAVPGSLFLPLSFLTYLPFSSLHPSCFLAVSMTCRHALCYPSILFFSVFFLYCHSLHLMHCWSSLRR